MLEPHDIATSTSTAEWVDGANVTNAEQLQIKDERFYQGHVKGRRFSFIAVSVKHGLVSQFYLFNSIRSTQLPGRQL